MILHGYDQVRLAVRSPVVTVEPTTTLRAAATALRREDIGALAVVVDGALAVVVDGELVGVLSERDVVQSLADGADPDRTQVERAMSDPPRAVEAGSPLSEVTTLMLHMGVGHLPVTDNGRAVGMVSMRDALRVMERDRLIEPGALTATFHRPLGPRAHTASA
jgi:CBS domain-containing protein